MDAAYGELKDGFPGFRIEYLHDTRTFSMPATHMHRHYELYYQLSGERTYFIEDRVYPVHAGDLVMVNIHDLHKTVAAGTPKFGRILISFMPDFLGEWTEAVRDADLFVCFRHGIRILRLPLARQSEAENLLFAMIDETRGRPPGCRTAVRLDLMRLLLLTARAARSAAAEKAPPVSPIHEKITRAAQYIGSHYTQPLSLRSIANISHVSYSYFCRVFRRVTGFTLTEYIRSVRIRRAAQLLRETGLSVTDIAGTVGFESSSSFGRVFRQIMHTSPSRYRREKR